MKAQQHQPSLLPRISMNERRMDPTRGESHTRSACLCVCFWPAVLRLVSVWLLERSRKVAVDLVRIDWRECLSPVAKSRNCTAPPQVCPCAEYFLLIYEPEVITVEIKVGWVRVRCWLSSWTVLCRSIASSCQVVWGAFWSVSENGPSPVSYTLKLEYCLRETFILCRSLLNTGARVGFSPGLGKLVTFRLLSSVVVWSSSIIQLISAHPIKVSSAHIQFCVLLNDFQESAAY